MNSNLNSKIIKFHNTSSQNPFKNYPAFTKTDTMFLSTIKPSDNSQNRYKSTPHILNLTTFDINKKKLPKKTRKNSSLKTSDIKNCRCKKHFGFIKKNYDKFLNNDILFNKPNVVNFKTKRFPTNPLCPVYNLPKLIPNGKIFANLNSAHKITYRYIKDSLRLDDIKGAKSELLIKNKYLKKTNFIEDIEIGKVVRKKRKNLKYENVKKKFKSRRKTDPLNPIYLFINKKTDKKREIGLIEKNLPKILHKNLKKKKDMNLNIRDIEKTEPFSCIKDLYKKKVL